MVFTMSQGTQVLSRWAEAEVEPRQLWNGLLTPLFISHFDNPVYTYSTIFDRKYTELHLHKSYKLKCYGGNITNLDVSHVNSINVRSFFSVYFNRYKIVIQELTNVFVFKRFPLHDMTPMTCWISNYWIKYRGR